MIKTFEELSRQLRGLNGLPLVVNNIHAADPMLRMTEVCFFFTHVNLVNEGME